MVLICSYPRCVNRRKRRKLRMLSRTHPGVVSFHQFPIYEPSVLKLWLIALRLDINTPINVLKLRRVCSEHFSPDNFLLFGVDRVVLTSSAVPMMFSHSTEESVQEPYQPTEHESDEGPATECLGAYIGPKDVQQSTPQKAMKSGAETCTRQEDKPHKHLLLLLKSPQSSEKHTYSSTSGTYYAIPVVRSLLDEPIAVDSEHDDLNISMLSLDPPSEKKDIERNAPGGEDRKIISPCDKRRMRALSRGGLTAPQTSWPGESEKPRLLPSCWCEATRWAIGTQTRAKPGTQQAGGHEKDV
ncbi:hypothetical protein DPEC_G00284100 [Dallia pectoralis]|uniref:Uncharacterized protein n=1 Tax=Dallia pectoralis TaxID=75939 RepID=A0ACC2FJA2_DALPE|nr:hypothetical protein DPEC_G00284100 [Dallia pectoralis]